MAMGLLAPHEPTHITERFQIQAEDEIWTRHESWLIGLDPGLRQIDYTHTRMSSNSLEAKERHGTWDTTNEVLRMYNVIFDLRFRRYHTQDRREYEKPFLVRSLGCQELFFGLPRLTTLEVDKDLISK